MGVGEELGEGGGAGGEECGEFVNELSLWNTKPTPSPHLIHIMSDIVIGIDCVGGLDVLELGPMVGICGSWCC